VTRNYKLSSETEPWLCRRSQDSLRSNKQQMICDIISPVRSLSHIICTNVTFCDDVAQKTNLWDDATNHPQRQQILYGRRQGRKLSFNRHRCSRSDNFKHDIAIVRLQALHTEMQTISIRNIYHLPPVASCFGDSAALLPTEFVKIRTGFSCLLLGSTASSSECCDEPSNSVTTRALLSGVRTEKAV
jgi:hypothetical protein